MDYKNHVKACLTVAIFSSIAGFQAGCLSFSGLQELWKGMILYTFLITCDLDSAESTVRKLWGPLKIIWRPFVDAGHREILHNPVWGPFILVSFLWVPLTAYGYHVSELSVVGAVLMLWTHIGVDRMYSGYREIVPNWLEKKIKKVF